MTKAEEWALIKQQAKALGLTVGGKKRVVLEAEVEAAIQAGQVPATTSSILHQTPPAPPAVYQQPGAQGGPVINTVPQEVQPLAPVYQTQPTQLTQLPTTFPEHPSASLQPLPGQQPQPLILDQGNITQPVDQNAAIRAQLLQQLAQLDGQMGIAPAHGPNYRAMSHTQVKTLCIGSGIIDRTGLMDTMISLLQAKDIKMGLQPYPEAQPVAPISTVPLTRPVSFRRTNTAGAPITGAIHIIDAHGRRFASAYLDGGMENGQPIKLDMEGNAQRIMDLFNAG